MRMFYTHSKPVIEKITAFITIVIFAPVFLLISVLNYFTYKKILFIQDRTGLNMKTFSFIKFQTMKQIDDTTEYVSDIERITPLGKFLRSTSLDELPQLFLVLKGDMSIIGPRPLPATYNMYYSDEQKQRFTVKPGLTGWAQVHGRNRISWEDRFELDNFYVKNNSFKMDILILVKTLFQLIKINEVNASADITMKPFKN